MGLAREHLPRYTYEDYKKWEGDWELIEGIPYALASPSFKHQRVVLRIARFLDEFLESRCSECSVGIDTDFVIDEHNVLRPDVFVVCEKVEDRLLKAPQIVFEVVSESTSDKDENLKKILYEREGVEYYVLVYPNLKKARIFRLKDGKYIKVFEAVQDTYEFELKKCSVPLDFSKVWE
ncbi:MAG: Uma2 family endonuclease [Aquificae bacterium]|nr:Uma2 family endonuclease [Aquificota bacterium]